MSSGVSAAQLFVLRSLATGEPASLSELAASTLTDRSSVAAVVDRLLEGGLVKRETSTADRRRASITITSAGRAMLKRAPEPPTALLMTGLEGLSASRLHALAGGLSALSREMGLEHRPAGMLFEDAVPERARGSRGGRQRS
jgi:DNA-binding MarR family transcriptional regulator